MDHLKLENLIARYGKDIYSFCVYLTKDKQEADDLYQDVFVTVMVKDDIDESENPKAYILTIATNIWNNRIRKFLWRSKKVDFYASTDSEDAKEIADESPSVEDAVIKELENKKVREAVYSLPDKFKIIVLMFYMQELSVEEIGKVLGVPAGTVKSRLFKARTLLKERMENEI